MSGPTPEKAMKYGLPDRWLHCPKMGKIVEDLFVPFKTPLCSLYDDQIDPQHRFHPEDIFNSPVLQGRKVGLWCDFTNTDRYYFKNEVESQGCIYKKIKMEGRGSTPTTEEVHQFILAVRAFLSKRKNDELIGVHCTHGFNRTGFAISSYLVEEIGCSIEFAIQSFASLRPCGIYKQDYINDLFQRFGDPDDTLEAPDRPSWELGEDTSVDFTSIKSVANGNAAATSSANSDIGPNGKQFMDGLVKGVYYLNDNTKKAMLQGRIKDLCNAKRNGFPGLQPVSLKRDNIELLAHEKYLVSWKADGMRYMVYITEEGEVYAFDRDNEVFQIEGLDFPHRKVKRSIGNTLFDAEMVIDKHTIDGKEVITPRLLIYDIIQYEEHPVGLMDYNTRRTCIGNEIIRPRREAQEAGKLRPQSMSVRQKDFWDLSAVHKFFEEKFTQNLGHEIDGLIFQPIDGPYTAGRCDKVLKWKPPSHNSIDFLLQIRKEKRPELLAEYWGYLYVQHQNEPFAKMKATRPLLPYDNKIIECTFDVARHEWKFMRERTDKSLPNAKTTAHNVYDSMVNPITKEMLIDYVHRFCLKRQHSHHHHQQRPAAGEPEAKKLRQE